jgi:hypothetical protein
MHQLPYFGVIAHSHRWRGGRSSWKIHDQIEKLQTKFAEHPREQLDIVCVADTGTFALKKAVHIVPDDSDHHLQELKEIGLNKGVSSMNVISDEEMDGIDKTGRILAEFVFEITARLAYDDPAVRPWADHLSMLGFYGGIGRPVYWSIDVLSKRVQEQFSSRADHGDHWNKWSESL